jgi:hypothetical protein
MKLSWESPIKLNKVVVHFDTDYDHALESVLRGHPERNIPFCVKKWRLLDLSADEEEIYLEDDNHHSRREVELESGRSVKELGVEILELNGDETVFGGIFEVRVNE